MKRRYYLFQRRKTYYIQDGETGQQRSLRMTDRKQAERIVLARNEAVEQPTLNLSLAKAYMAAHDSAMVERTWRDVMSELSLRGGQSTRERVEREFRSKAYRTVWRKRLIETKSEDFLAVLRAGGQSTNLYLRRLQNLALGLGWLPWPVLTRDCWPKRENRPKRGITWDEHQAILEAEPPGERRLYYDFLWETGTSQTDAANIEASNIDWEQGLLIYFRQKLRSKPCGWRIAIREVLSQLEPSVRSLA